MTFREIVHKMDDEHVSAIAEKIVDGLKISIMNNRDDISALSAKKTISREIKWGEQDPPYPPDYLRKRILSKVTEILREKEEITLTREEDTTETNTDFNSKPFPVLLSLSEETIADH